MRANLRAQVAGNVPGTFTGFKSMLLKYGALGVCFCLLLTGFSSCRRAGGDAFVMVLEASPKSLNPLIGTDAASERLRQLMFNTLMRKNEQFDYIGELAENVQTAPDGLAVTFTLHDNVKFHNGQPLTSADVKYTFDKLFASDSPKAPSFFETVNGNKQPFVTAVEAPDARTVIFRLRRPWLELYASLVAVPVIQAGTFETQAQRPMGTGAFKFAHYDESQQIVDMEANDSYWEGAPDIKRLRVKVILDANTQQAELIAGHVDLAINTALSPDAYVNLGQNPRLQVKQSPGVNVQYLGFNAESAPVNDARVRQAIAYAIDRESIIKNLLQGQARLAHSILPQESWAYATEQPQYTYDPAQAKRLLDEAGLRDPDGDGQSNLFEFTAGLAPDDPKSRFVHAVAPVAGQPGQRRAHRYPGDPQPGRRRAADEVCDAAQFQNLREQCGRQAVCGRHAKLAQGGGHPRQHRHPGR